MSDWVPMAFYGDDVAVPALSVAFVILYPLPDFAAGDVEFEVEEPEESNLFLERVIGRVHVSIASEGSGEVGWRLMPMGVDYEAPAVLEPFTTNYSYLSSEWANLRWWDERVMRVDDQSFASDLVDHPAWTHVDVNPRQLMGSGRNLWPVLALQNRHPTLSARFRHRLRALWK